MSFSKSIFGKELFELTYQDIVCFFEQEREETLNLEFKSYVNNGSLKEKEKVIFKSVCALLNSEGGILIWGAPIETSDDNKITKASGKLTPFNVGLDKDKLINKLSSVLIPMPIDIKTIFLENEERNSVVIIEVPKSLERPHQYDNLYYVRLDGQTRIAPHYLIKALIQSKDFPIIRGHVKLKVINTDGSRIILTFRKLLYNTSHFNNEINPFYNLFVHPGQIILNKQNKGSTLEGNFPILSYGRPEMFDFHIILNNTEKIQDLDILLQFGGEKSPSKMSTYTYNFNSSLVMGNVVDENMYLKTKEENKLASDVADRTDDDKIKTILEL